MDNVFCYVHFTDGFRVLYGWASVFPIIGSISLTSFLTITFFRVCKLTTHSYLMLKTVSELFSAKTFGLFQSLIECIYRHLILDIGAWTNLNIKETGKLRWNRVNICSPPFSTIKLLNFIILLIEMEPGKYLLLAPFSTTNKSSSQQKITELWIRALECWNTQWRKRFIFRFPQIGRISLDNRTNIYLSDSKWESTEVPWKTANKASS